MTNDSPISATAAAAAAAAAAAGPSKTTLPYHADEPVPRLTVEQMSHLATHGWLVAPQFISPALAASLRDDIYQLRTATVNSSSKKNNQHGYFAVAKIGEQGAIQDDTTPYRDIRHSETCEISPGVSSLLPPHPARQAAYALLDQLRIDLQQQQPPSEQQEEEKTGTTTVVNLQLGPATAGLTLPLDPQLAELMYAYYPHGGYYRRHRDAEAATPSAWRQYSFLLYLNENWDASVDGGALRLHRDSGHDTLPADELPNFVDVPPHEGTLVVFRSDLVPHEVLTTYKERSAVVGWFLSAAEPATAQIDSPPCNVDVVSQGIIDADTLTSLRALREAVPRMAQKLQPQPPVDHSGMIWADPTNEWGIVMAGTPPPTPAATTEPLFEDTDVRYWKKIATFTTAGKVQTLSLGGQRLRQMNKQDVYETLVQLSLLSTVVTLDLANTDLSLEVLTAVLKAAPLVRQLFLGGNGLGAAGLEAILPYLPSHAEILDLRYNDLDGRTAETQLAALQSEKLYLEGNPIGDMGAAALSLTVCRELYIGQCAIGTAGAAAIAAKLLGSPLEKLYLEGNRIGDAGADALRDVLKQGGHRLDKLYADNNGLSKEHAIALGAAVNSATVIGESGFYQD